jgi:hypothetical protein
VFISDWRDARREVNHTKLGVQRGLSKTGSARHRALLSCAAVAMLAPLAAKAHTDDSAASNDPMKLQSAAALQPSSAATTPAATTSDLTISTDRPSFSDGTGIQPLGTLNIETGYTFTFRKRDGAENQRHNGPEVLARVGILEDRLELRLITAGYTWARTNDGSGSGYQSAHGWNDMTAGFKLKVIDQKGWIPRLAVEAQTTLGVGSDSVSNQIAEPTIKLLWSEDLGEAVGETWKGWVIGGNANLRGRQPPAAALPRGRAQSTCHSR